MGDLHQAGAAECVADAVAGEVIDAADRDDPAVYLAPDAR